MCAFNRPSLASTKKSNTTETETARREHNCWARKFSSGLFTEAHRSHLALLILDQLARTIQLQADDLLLLRQLRFELNGAALRFDRLLLQELRTQNNNDNYTQSDAATAAVRTLTKLRWLL